MREQEQLNGAGGRHVGRVHSWRKGRAKKTVGVPVGRVEFCIIFMNFVMLFPSLHPIAAGANLRTAGKAIGWGGAHQLVLYPAFSSSS